MTLAADGAVVCDLLIRFVVKLSSSRGGLGNCGYARCELGKRCRMFFLARVLRASSAWALRLLTAPWPARWTQSGSVLVADGSGLCSSSPASLRSSLVSFTIIFFNISPRDLNMSGTVGSSRCCVLGWPSSAIFSWSLRLATTRWALILRSSHLGLVLRRAVVLIAVGNQASTGSGTHHSYVVDSFTFTLPVTRTIVSR